MRRLSYVWRRRQMEADRAEELAFHHAMKRDELEERGGLMTAAAGGRLVDSFLFGMPPLDALTFGGAAVLFLAVGATACYVPARHATKIDPMVALRSENRLLTTRGVG